MPSENLQRTTYRDPKQNPQDPPVRQGNATWQENAQDMDQYYLPHERIHGSSLHGWGVATGLEVTVTLNSPNPNLTVSPGVALDSSGHHISLAVKGKAEIGQNPTGFSNGATFTPVTDTGVIIPTANIAGDKYLTIAFLETFDDEEYNNGHFRYFHTPWLQLLDVTGFSNNGTRIVLAKVSLSNGQVTNLTQDIRQNTQIAIGALHIQQSSTTTPATNMKTSGTSEAGVIRASSNGGLEIDTTRLATRRSDGTESVVIDVQGGTITAGTTGVNGEVIVNNAQNQPAIVLNGGIATVEVGGSTTNGILQVLRADGTATCTLHGQDGHGAFTTVKVVNPNGGASFNALAANDSTGLFAQHTTANYQVTLASKDRAAYFDGPVDISGNITASGRVGIETTAPTHPLHVNGNTGIRQNRLYMSGGDGWSSLSYNAYHNDANNAWVFPDPSRPAVTIEMDDHNGTPRVQVFSTTTSAPTTWVQRLAIDGNSGNVSVNGNISSGTNGINGEVIVNNAQNQPAIVLNGGIATVEVGGSTTNGILQVLRTDGTATCTLYGQDGHGAFTTVKVVNPNGGASFNALVSNNSTGLFAQHTTANYQVTLASKDKAAYFDGPVDMTGPVTKPGSTFKIDHPLDPANKYLCHSVVESPDMKNVYDGIAVLDTNGEAVIELPIWFEALNQDFRYQLTCIGGHAPVYIAEKVHAHRFKIAGGTPDLEVSWQVTGIRQDAWANAYRFPVEEDKSSEEQGYYIHPELFGAPKEKQVQRLHHPETVTTS
jgi:hypothetical protein